MRTLCTAAQKSNENIPNLSMTSPCISKGLQQHVCGSSLKGRRGLEMRHRPSVKREPLAAFILCEFELCVLADGCQRMSGASAVTSKIACAEVQDCTPGSTWAVPGKYDRVFIRTPNTRCLQLQRNVACHLESTFSIRWKNHGVADCPQFPKAFCIVLGQRCCCSGSVSIL